MKRRIIIPETLTVSIATPQGEVSEPFSFVDLITKTLLNDRRYAVDRAAFRLADDVEDFFKDAKPGDVVDLPETLWKLLSQVADKPQFGQQGNVGFTPTIRQLRSYLDAICDAPEAKDEPPPAAA